MRGQGPAKAAHADVVDVATADDKYHVMMTCEPRGKRGSQHPSLVLVLLLHSVSAAHLVCDQLHKLLCNSQKLRQKQCCNMRST
jgi:hypothetical protein